MEDGAGDTDAPERRVAKVVVLGDISRSPRMQYHAVSIANSGLAVHVIGYVQSALPPHLAHHPLITIHRMNPYPFDGGPRLIKYLLKAIWQFFSLMMTLQSTGRCDYLLCQNPPALPTLPACSLYSCMTGAKFYIDWHNYAYSIMALSLKSSHPLLKFSRYIEKTYGKHSHHNFCVTRAMKLDLNENWNIRATVLYDRPPKIFHPISLPEKHKWFLKLSSKYPEFGGGQRDHAPHSTTAFTYKVEEEVKQWVDRPALLFSSTSWTEDEDFGILLSALEVYEEMYDKMKTLPKVVCVITGKGPMKQHYKDLIAAKSWQHVTVMTPWLEARDYPTMVASADLGVCLHTSSSGLDLPMKVVDMFGAGLPLCAYEFKCLDELVKHEVNGYTFKNSKELSEQIITWFEEFPNNAQQNKISQRMKDELAQFQKVRWEDNWNERAREYFLL